MLILHLPFHFVLSFGVLSIGLVYFLSYYGGSGRYLVLTDLKRSYIPLGEPFPERFFCFLLTHLIWYDFKSLCF